jgi:hypothetical protein
MTFTTEIRVLKLRYTLAIAAALFVVFIGLMTLGWRKPTPEQVSPDFIITGGR